MLDDSLKIGGSSVVSAPRFETSQADESIYPNEEDNHLTESELDLARVLSGQYSMPKVDEHFYEPTTSMTVNERLADYEAIPSHLLTAHTDQLIRIGEIRSDLLNLTPKNVREHLGELKLLSQELVKRSYEALSLYTRDGFLASFAIQRLLDESYSRWPNEGRAIAMVLDLHMRQLNKANESKALGDWYLPQLREWIQNHITKSQEAYEQLIDPPTVVQAPQNTAFLFISSNSHEGKRFLKYSSRAFSHFESDMEKKMIGAIDRGELPNDIDTSMVRFMATGFYRHIELGPNGDSRDHLVGELADIMSTTSYLKAHGDPRKAVFTGGGITMYDETAISKAVDANDPTLKRYRDGKVGFVHMGEFIPSETFHPGSSIESEQRELHERTNIPSQIGDISRPWELMRRTDGKRFWDGGDMEHFMSVVDAILKHHDRIDLNFYMPLFYAELRRLTDRVIHMGEDARRDPQFRMLVNSMRDWHGLPNDFFLEEVGKAIVRNAWNPRSVYFIAAEGDDAGRFAQKFQPRGPSDEYFQLVSWLAFKVARNMGLPAPIMAREGDQWRVAMCSPSSRAAELFARYWQKEVHSRFGGMLMDVDGGRKGLTLSITMSRAPDLLDFDASREATPLLRKLAFHAETVKHAGGWQKEGFGWVRPYNNINRVSGPFRALSSQGSCFRLFARTPFRV